jgi:hypothetical protein
MKRYSRKCLTSHKNVVGFKFSKGEPRGRPDEEAADPLPPHLKLTGMSFPLLHSIDAKPQAANRRPGDPLEGTVASADLHVDMEVGKGRGGVGPWQS